MINDQSISTVWKKNLNKFLKNSNSEFDDLIFQSINTGKHVSLKNCSFNDLLPYSLASSPISSISPTDNVWIASSMLSRVSDITNNLVVIGEDFPMGILGAKEILKGLLKNPTPYYFHDSLAEEIMNRDFYLDTRNVKLDKILKQMKKTKNEFIIIQNSKNSFSSVSIREILEVGSLCKTDFKSSELVGNELNTIKRDDSVEDLIKLLVFENSEMLFFENEMLFIDPMTIIEKICGDLNYLKDCEKFLDLNASILKFEQPKLIPNNITFSEICQTMISMKHPCVMTSDKLLTPRSVLQILSKDLKM